MYFFTYKKYIDKVVSTAENKNCEPDTYDIICIDKEVDRIYSPSKVGKGFVLELHEKDSSLFRRVVADAKSGPIDSSADLSIVPDCVLWNAWIDKAKVRIIVILQ
jgi:hypothetical protein